MEVIMGYEVVVKWIPEDISGHQPDWHESKCEFVLDEISHQLQERVVEFGNEVLEELLSEWIDESEEHYCEEEA
jgi:hypothetical protein